jgi:hypothetical protein
MIRGEVRQLRQNLQDDGPRDEAETGMGVELLDFYQALLGIFSRRPQQAVFCPTHSVARLISSLSIQTPTSSSASWTKTPTCVDGQ